MSVGKESEKKLPDGIEGRRVIVTELIEKEVNQNYNIKNGIYEGKIFVVKSISKLVGGRRFITTTEGAYLFGEEVKLFDGECYSCKSMCKREKRCEFYEER